MIRLSKIQTVKTILRSAFTIGLFVFAQLAVGQTITIGTGTANLIPFTFVYRGNNYTSLRMSTNGFITLGNAITPATTNYTPISNSVASSVYAIAGLGCDLNAAVRHDIIGTTPNRVFGVQWSNAYRYSPGPGSSESLNFQVRLYETYVLFSALTCVHHARTINNTLTEI